MHTVILAGGFATRLWPLTEARAKPLLPLAGKPLIAHLLEQVPEGIPVTITTNAAFADGFRAWLRTVHRTDVRLVIEKSLRDDQKAGALGALAQWVAEESIADDLLLLTGDNYLGFSLRDFLDAYDEGTPLLAAYDIADLTKASQFGTVILDPTNPRRIAGFEEKPPQAKTTLVSTGCSILPKATLPILTDFARKHPDNVGGIFEEFLRRNLNIDCFVFTEPWLDIGAFSSYLDAHRLLVGDAVLRAPTASLTDTSCVGSVSLGDGSTVTGSELEDCIIFDRCEIVDCVLRDCVVDDGCRLRGIDLTGKMIRKGTELILT